MAAKVSNFDLSLYICTYHVHITYQTYHVDQCFCCESCHVLLCLAMSCHVLPCLVVISVISSVSYRYRRCRIRVLNWTSFPTEARRLGSCWACRCNLKPPRARATQLRLPKLHLLHPSHPVSSECPAYSDDAISGIDDASAHLTLKCIGMHWK